MARLLTAKDAHTIMNALVAQATGDTALTVTDTSSFVSAGEMLMASGTENVLNALSLIIGRTLVASRPYSGKLNILNAINTDVYSHRLRKISFYGREAEAAGFQNTDLYTNFAPGYDNGNNSNNSTASMWVQNQPIPLEMNFAGSSVWQDCSTIYQVQLQQAFRDEASFNQFITGVLTERENDMESQKEAFRRMTLLNFIAGVKDIGYSINLLTAFNADMGTSYNVTQLLQQHTREFYEYFVSTVRKVSDMLTERTSTYHWNPTRVDGLKLLRHTPKDKQKMILYKPMFIDAEARVFPEIFNEQYIKMSNYESVNFWQSSLTPETVNITPAIPDNTGVQIQGNAFNPDYVVGLIYDEDALMVDFQLESALATPIEARKKYYNVWYSFQKNAINDFTENAVLLYLA